MNTRRQRASMWGFFLIDFSCRSSSILLTIRPSFSFIALSTIFKTIWITRIRYVNQSLFTPWCGKKKNHCSDFILPPILSLPVYFISLLQLTLFYLIIPLVTLHILRFFHISLPSLLLSHRSSARSPTAEARYSKSKRYITLHGSNGRK
jgi:hypothetical protein